MNTYKYPLFLKLYEIIDNGTQDKNIYLVEQLADGVMACIYQNIHKNILDETIIDKNYPQFKQIMSLNVIRENYQFILIQMMEISLALYHLHYFNLIHGDIKQANILKIKGPTYILADFGLTQPESSGKRYNIPISVAYQSADNEGLTKQNDMWCLGVLLFMQITGYHPSQFCYAYAFQNKQNNIENYQQLLMENNQQIFQFTINYLIENKLIQFDEQFDEQQKQQRQDEIIDILKLVFECFQPKQQRITSEKFFKKSMKCYIQYYSQFYISNKVSLEHINQDMNQFQKVFNQNNDYHVLFLINYCNHTGNQQVYQNFFLQEEKKYNIFQRSKFKLNEELIKGRLEQSKEQAKTPTSLQTNNINFDTSSKNLQTLLQDKLSKTTQSQSINEHKRLSINNMLSHDLKSKNLSEINEEKVQSLSSGEDDEIQQIISFDTENSNQSQCQAIQGQLSKDTFTKSSIKTSSQSDIEERNKIQLFDSNQFSDCDAFGEEIFSDEEGSRNDQNHQSKLFNKLIGDLNNNSVIQSVKISNKQSDKQQSIDILDSSTSFQHIDDNQKQSNIQTVQSKKYPGIKIQKSLGQKFIEKIGYINDNLSDSSSGSIIIKPAKQKNVECDQYNNQQTNNQQVENQEQSTDILSNDDVIALSQYSLSNFENQRAVISTINANSIKQITINYEMQQRQNFYIKDSWKSQSNIKNKQLQQLFQNISYEKNKTEFNYDQKQDQNKLLGLGSFSANEPNTMLTGGDNQDQDSFEDDDDIVDITNEDSNDEKLNKLLNIDDEDISLQYQNGLIFQGQAKFQKIDEHDMDQYALDGSIINEYDTNVEEAQEEPKFLQQTRELLAQERNTSQINTQQTFNFSLQSAIPQSLQQTSSEMTKNMDQIQPQINVFSSILDRKEQKGIQQFVIEECDTQQDQHTGNFYSSSISLPIQQNQLQNHDFHSKASSQTSYSLSGDHKFKLFQNNSAILDNCESDSKNLSYSIDKLTSKESDQTDLISMRQTTDYSFTEDTQLSTEQRLLYFSYCYILLNKIWFELSQRKQQIKISRELIDMYHSLLEKYNILIDKDTSMQLFSKENILQEFQQIISYLYNDFLENQIQQNDGVYTTLQCLSKAITYIAKIFSQPCPFLIQYTGWIIMNKNTFYNLFKTIFLDWNNDNDKFGVNLFVNDEQLLQSKYEKYHNIELYIGLKYAEQSPIVGIRHKSNQRVVLIQASDRQLNLQLNQQQANEQLEKAKDLQEKDKNIYAITNKYFKFVQSNWQIPENKNVVVSYNPIYDVYFLNVSEHAIVPVHLMACIGDLINNSRNYSHNQSTIRVSIFNSKNYLYLIVNDIGQGLQEENSMKPYYKANFGQKKTDNENLRAFGYGTGLKHVKSIVNYYKGVINISSSQNGGTKLIIKIKLGHKFN